MNERLWSILIDSFPKLLAYGIKVTVPLTIFSFAIALVVALLVALVQYANVRGEQEQQIAELNEELQNKNATIRVLNQNVADLTASNEEKDHTIARKIAEANKAYYVVGTFKDLKSLGVIDKIGVSKRRQQTTTSMETSVFTEIDRTQVTSISINAKKVKVVSKHPETSYQLVEDPNDSKVISYLKVLDPDQFWKYTDYLVISTR